MSRRRRTGRLATGAGSPSIVSRDKGTDQGANAADATRKAGNLSTFLRPGQRVRLRAEPDWGTGQIQSVVGDRVTVNFEHAGKQLINTAATILDVIDDTQ